MTLNDLKAGQQARVLDVTASGATGQRLLDMGFVEGTPVQIVRNAPLVDPMDILVRGCHVSIRHDEAKTVEVELS